MEHIPAANVHDSHWSPANLHDAEEGGVVAERRRLCGSAY